MRSVPAVLCTVLLLSSCSDEIPRGATGSEAEDSVATEVPPADDGVVIDPELTGASPSEGYAAWVASLRSGLATIERQAQTDREEALRTAQELYSTRHDQLNLHYGEGGTSFAGDALAQAVERSASAFRDLMRQLASVDADAAPLGRTLQEARLRLDEVEGEARAAGLQPGAPRTR